MPSSSSRPQGLLHRAQLQLLTPEPSPLCPAHDPGAFSTMPSSSSRPWSLLHRAQLQFPQEFLSPSLISPFLPASAAPTLLQTIRLATSKQPTSWDLQIPTLEEYTPTSTIEETAIGQPAYRPQMPHSGRAPPTQWNWLHWHCFKCPPSGTPGARDGGGQRGRCSKPH